MTNQQSPGFLHSILTALRGALTGGPRAGPGTRDTPRHDPESDFEPVHGWTIRQRDDYLARNPDYRPTYEAELNKHRSAGARPPFSGGQNS